MTDDRRRRMSDADPWWSAMSESAAAIRPDRDLNVSQAVMPNFESRRNARRRRREASLKVRIFRSKKFRQIRKRTMIALMLATFVSGCVSVIMLNNLVISRSVELGELDSERRELRTDNALLSAEIARLSAPPRVAKEARKKLGMQPSPVMARFIYLDEANSPKKRKRLRKWKKLQQGSEPRAPQGGVAQ